MRIHQAQPRTPFIFELFKEIPHIVIFSFLWYNKLKKRLVRMRTE